MDFDLAWILLGLPLAFVLGWLASRFDLRQLRVENRRAPKAYFKGLNFLLNEQQDQAIDAFIEAVQSDPDTSELHFALGNLFRRRGEYDRAVRVHEHLLSRGDLPAGRPHARPACAGAGLPQGRPAGPRRRRAAQAGKHPVRNPGAPGLAGHLRALTRVAPGRRGGAQAGGLGRGQLCRTPGALPVRTGRRADCGRRSPRRDPAAQPGHRERSTVRAPAHPAGRAAARRRAGRRGTENLSGIDAGRA